MTLENGVPLLEASLLEFELLSTGIQELPAGDAALFEFRYGHENGCLHTMQLVFTGTISVFAVTVIALDSVFSRHLPVTWWCRPVSPSWGGASRPRRAYSPP